MTDETKNHTHVHGMARMNHGDPTDGRFLSRSECRSVIERIASFRAGGGEVGLRLDSSWNGHTRYVRNRIHTSGEVLQNNVIIIRDIDGAHSEVPGNQIDDVSLLAGVRRAERLLRLAGTQSGGIVFQEHFALKSALALDTARTRTLADSGGLQNTTNTTHADYVKDATATRDSVAHAVGADRAGTALMQLGMSLTRQSPEPHTTPTLFFNSTYDMDPHHRATAIGQLAGAASAKGMLASGYLETLAHGRAVMDTWGRMLYYPSTEARYSVTVRSPDGSGSGWAGVMWNDWSRVEPEKIQAIALQKCLDSRNPVRVEPGRYTTILEPQAVHQLFFLALSWMGTAGQVDRIDPRLTASQDPMDPDCGSMPFDAYGNSYHAETWYKNGQLVRIPQSRAQSITHGENVGHLCSAAYRLRGTTETPMSEMIASTQRGIIVTRFLITATDPPRPKVVHGYTRDGTWLIEHGRITKPVKNFRFRTTVDAVMTNVEQIGIAQRVYTPEYPNADTPDYAAVVPALKVRDFDFVAISDAV